MNEQIVRAARLLWAYASLGEYYLCTEHIGDWDRAQRYRRGARRILAWFEYWFGPEVVGQADSDVVKRLTAELVKQITQESRVKKKVEALVRIALISAVKSGELQFGKKDVSA